MLFNSFEFLIFLPAVFALYWAIDRIPGRRGLRAQNLLVIAASYLFYGWWDWRFLGLIAFATGISFISGLLLGNARSRLARRIICGGNIAVALGLLGVFKYFNFFAANFASLLSLAGFTPDDFTLQIVLPVGISFYTFQTLSYTIDVYRRDISPTRDAAAYFAFISFFPQLVAGPIERASNLLPQFLRRRTFSPAAATDGLRLILWGLFKKVAVADNCGAVVDRIFADYSHLGSLTLIAGAVLFAFQIYGDFSGYTDIAIGTARLFGVSLRPNFKMPYFSRDIVEFWRRWHISLTSWFRDYLYIPLGGNRRGLWHTVAYTAVVFILSGLWHGANWTFISWGAFNALLFIPLIVSGTNNRHRGTTVAQGRILPSPAEAAMMGATFALVVIGWVLYRAESISHAAAYLRRAFGGYSSAGNHLGAGMACIFVAVMLIMEWTSRCRNHGLDIAGHGLLRHRAARWALYWALTLTVLLQTRAMPEAFIYFQF